MALPAVTTIGVQSLKEETKHLDPLRQSPSDKVDGLIHFGSLNSSDGSIVPPKKPRLPSYGFRFKCDERTEKRKEFYSKLKEKKQKKELERIALQEKSKEIQDAEIKMLRKTLTFKANPMPSFYYETAPSKVELKKTPPTRARSPKFSHRKRSIKVNSEELSSHNSQMSQASQDEKANRMGINKGSSSFPFKKPHHKFLTKLPTDPSRLAKAKEYVAPSIQHPHHLDVEKVGLIPGPNESQLVFLA